MSQHFPALIAVLPLAAALISPLLSYINRHLGKWVVIVAIGLSFCCSIGVLTQTLQIGTIHYFMGDWPAPIGIEFVLDPLNAALAVLVTFVSLMVGIYGTPFFANSDWMKIGGYYTLFGLLTAGLVGMIITGDVFNLYVFLEISSLACYGLIALGGRKSTLAAFRYLLIGTIGASLYLLGVGYLYGITGTLNMADMAQRIVPLLDSPATFIAVGMFVVGFGIKMALFPLHGWQPDAYTYAHPAAAPLISGIMSKVPAYAILRFFFYVFGAGSFVVQAALDIMGVLACAGIILGSVMAIAQKDFRRMLAYSSVAQIGYIIVGFAIGNVYGLIGAVLHIIGHAFMKGTLFLSIGGVQYRYGETNIDRFGRLYSKMPATSVALVIAAMSMVGLPPTIGFFSKWYLVLGAMQTEQYIYIAIIIISSLLNAIYFFRVIEKMFINQKDELKEVRKVPGGKELPWAMIIPILVMGLGILVLGLYNEQIVTQILQFALPEVFLR